MGKKGDKITNDSTVSANMLLEKLATIANITAKKMFGGHGIFYDGKMFGIVDSKGACYLKADDSNRSDFEERGAEKHGRMPYYAIPEDVIEDAGVLKTWAENAIKTTK